LNSNPCGEPPTVAVISFLTGFAVLVVETSKPVLKAYWLISSAALPTTNIFVPSGLKCIPRGCPSPFAALLFLCKSNASEFPAYVAVEISNPVVSVHS
jgi:hypothetical protein